MTGSKPLDQLDAACKGFRDTLPRLIRQVDDNASMSKDVVKALCLLKNIKQSTRETFLDAEVYRRRVAEQKDLVESHHLKLQNLLYEKDHLMREIKRCRGFPTKEMDKIEFRGDPLPVTVDADRHAQHLKRLDDELESRQAMLQHQKDLKAEIAQVDEAVQEKRALLDGVPAEVAAIEQATLPLQSLLSVPLSATFERQEEAKQLPAPLYILYCELEAYMEIHGGMSLSIGQAKGLLSKSKSRKAVQPEEPPAAKRQKTTTATTLSRSPSPANAATPPSIAADSTESTYTPAPHTLVVELHLVDTKTKVIFTYLPHLKVVVVETPRYPHMLRNLFGEDSGIRHPNVATLYAFEVDDGLEMDVDFPADARARPYLWAQWICGFHYGKRSELATRPEPSIRQVMARLHQRYTAHHILQQQLDALKEKRIAVHASASKTWAAAAVTTKLDSWIKVSRDDKLFAEAHDGYVYYRAMLYHDAGRVAVWVEISPAYPKEAPRIVCQNEKESAALPTAAQLKDMDVEVNAFAMDLVTDDTAGWLLPHQLRKLQMCLDTVNTLGTAKASEYAFGKKR
ncbi:Aste57867_9475 [Aphanomyces stellatus]|uniref:Aste57867_9475 protein n=1 Tax=Aphanomyces stellatus TaxID=120398 RepID=A0A485KNC0_9STRA|nr:hypothetical protein As57867_009438 [Aphanomyces stellatus]VFT86354.1 Aste57867_9475 [Aphanomyces stellatus]